MRIAVEVLGRELEQFGIFERFHLMDEARRDIHALARRHLEFVNHVGISGILDPDLEPAGAKKERFGLELMEMQ